MRGGWHRLLAWLRNSIKLVMKKPSTAGVLAVLAIKQQDDTLAQQYLSDATKDLAQLAEPLRSWVAYHAGLHALRQQDLPRAQAFWDDLPQAYAEVIANSLAQRAPSNWQSLPDGELKQFYHNLALSAAIEQRDLKMARDLVDPSRRDHNFFRVLLELIESNGGDLAIKKLALDESAASDRWQLYGYLLAGRNAEAQQLIQQMSSRDGFALAAEIYLAFLKQDEAQMQAAYQRIDAAIDPLMPTAYRDLLISEFESGGNQLWTISFVGPDGSILPRGWQRMVSQQGSGISTQVSDGTLVVGGTQRQPSWVGVSGPISGHHVRRIVWQIDVSGLGSEQALVSLSVGQRTSARGFGLWLEGGRVYQARNDGARGWQRGRQVMALSGRSADVWQIDMSHDPQTQTWSVHDRDKAIEIVPSRALSGHNGPIYLGLIGQGEIDQAWRLQTAEIEVELDQHD